jgi:hypothetical protein
VQQAEPSAAALATLPDVALTAPLVLHAPLVGASETFLSDITQNFHFQQCPLLIIDMIAKNTEGI